MTAEIRLDNGSANLVPNIHEIRPGVAAARYEYHLVTTDPDDQRGIQNRAYPLYFKYLHKDNIIAGLRLVDKIGPDAIVGFAQSARGRDEGFTVFHLYQSRGLLVASVDATVVDEQFQGHGIAEQFARDIMTGDAVRQANVDDLSKLEIIDAMTARNSTPWPLLAKLNTGWIEKYYANPVQKYFSPDIRVALLEINRKELFDDQGKLRYEPHNGLWTNIYSFEQGHSLEIDPQEHPEGAAIYDFWLKELKMKPENNDAVQVWLKVAKGKVRDSLRRSLTEERDLTPSA